VNNVRSYYNILRWITESALPEDEEAESEEVMELASNEPSVAS
jgi:hypothetical protein